MSKILLSTLLATTVMFSSALKASETDMTPPVHQEQTVMEKHHKKFDKNFHKEMAKKMAQDLGLTQEQQEKAEKIRLEGRKKIKPLMKEMLKLREKIDNERKENMEEFMKILTPEQKDKFEKMHNEAVSKFKKMIEKKVSERKKHKNVSNSDM